MSFANFFEGIAYGVRQFRECKALHAMSNDEAITKAKNFGIKIIDAEPATLAFQARRKCIIRAALALELQDRS